MASSKYGKFGKTVEAEEKKRKREEEKPYKPLDPNTSAVTKTAQSAPQSGGSGTNPLLQLKDLPKLYEGEGKDRKINPTYDTSIGQDMVAGAALASQNRTGNPFYDLGAGIGGLLGGAFSKNLAGKMKHRSDVAAVQAENKDAILKTEAYQRAEAQKIAVQREARLQQGQEFRQQLQLEKQKVKGQGDTSRFLISAAQAAPTPEARMELSQQFNELWGIDDTPNANFGQKYKVEKVGDYAMLFDEQSGELVNAKGEDGKNISALDTARQLDILKKWTGLSEKETPDLVSAMNTADEYIAKNFKGGLKAQQYNSLKMQLTREILKMNKDGGTGKVIVNGQVIPLPDLSILNQKPPLANDSPDGNSQFMPPLSNEPQQVYDATNGQPPSNIPRTDKQPVEVTKSDNEYPLSIVSNDGKSYATRQVFQGTEGLDKKKSYLSKDKKTRLIFQDGAWYQVKLQ